MKRVCAFAAVIPAAVAAVVASAFASGTPNRSLFDYDRAAPLNVVRGTVTTAGHVVRQELTFSGDHSTRLAAYFVHPVSGGPWPLVVWTPGNGGDRREELPEASAFARAGGASLLVDPPPVADLITCDASKDLAAYVAYVVDRRRAIDVAETLPGVEKQRIGAAGFSFGSSITGTLAGVDRRIVAFALKSGRGHHTGFTRIVCKRLAQKKLNAYSARLGVVDPVHWAASAAPAPMLLQNGTYDPWTTKADVLALYRAAKGPKEVRFYDAGHDLNNAAATFERRWLLQKLGNP